MPDLNGLTLTQQMMSSCAGGIITALFMTPFDVVKVRLQAQQRALMNSQCFLYCNGLMDHICNCSSATNGTVDYRPWYSRPIPNQLNGTFDAFVKISRSEGLKSLWSGLPPTLIVAIPNTIVYLTSYEKILKSVRQYFSPEEQPFWAGGVSGGLARSWVVTLFSPLELLRTKIQSKRMSYKDVFVVLANELKTIGPSSLWRGWAATVSRDVPFSILYWMAYENMKQLVHQEQPTFYFSLLAGGLSGGLAGMLTLPLDVVKTHQQIEIGRKTERARSTRTLLMQIYTQQGVRGLYTGLIPRLAKVMPACGIMIASYEYAKAYFRQKNSLLHSTYR